MRSFVLLLGVLAATAVVLVAEPFADAGTVRSVSGLEAPKRATAAQLAGRGLPVRVKVPKGARVVHVSLVKLRPRPVRLLVARDFRVRGNRRVKLRFVVRRAGRLAGNGPFEVRVRAGRTAKRLGPRKLRQRLSIVKARSTPAPAGPAPAPVTPAPSAPAPAPVTPVTPVTVAAVGDFCGGCKDVAAEVRGMSPYRLLALGDYEYDNAGSGGSAFKSGYESIFAGLHAITIPTFGSTHDTCDGSGSWECYPVSFFNANGAPEVRGKLADGQWGYAVDLPNGWHLVNLNYNNQDLGQLSADLAGRGGQCVIAQLHAPVYGSPSSEHPKDEGSGFANALNAGGVDVIVSGHQHFYERNAYAQGTSFTVGTGGVGAYDRTSTAPSSQKYLTGTLGLLKLTLTPGHWDAQFVSTGGAVLDSASGDCAD